MSFYPLPEKPPTEEEKLLAAVIAVDHRIPVGFQIGMPMHLARSIADVEKLFTEHNLPNKEALIGELNLWHSHAEQGLKFAHQCDRLMRGVVRTVGDAVDKQR